MSYSCLIVWIDNLEVRWAKFSPQLNNLMKKLGLFFTRVASFCIELQLFFYWSKVFTVSFFLNKLCLGRSNLFGRIGKARHSYSLLIFYTIRWFGLLVAQCFCWDFGLFVWQLVSFYLLLLLEDDFFYLETNVLIFQASCQNFFILKLDFDYLLKNLPGVF